MKSVLVTAMVLSSSAAQSFAATAGKDDNGRRDSKQLLRSIKRPDIKAQPTSERSAARGSEAPARQDSAVAPKQKSTPAPSQTQDQGKFIQPRSFAKMRPKTQFTQPPAAQSPSAPATAKPTPKLTPQVQQQQQQTPSRLQQRPTVLQGPKAQVPPKMVIRPGQMHPNVIAQRYPHVRNFVDLRGRAYRSHYHDRLLVLQKRYLAPTYFAPLRLAYRPWFRVGFYAYGYPVRPVVEFYSYFSNPCVAWFYNDYDAGFYQPFYGQYVTRYPDLGRGYARVGIFLPTEEFMALNVSISEMPIARQVHYRRAMVYLGDRLSARYHRPIAQHQVIVNHYQMLPSNRAVVVEGFVDNDQVQMPFKAMVDLDNSDNSMLFAVDSWKAEDQPTSEQSEDLFDLNDQITEYGGTLESAPST